MFYWIYFAMTGMHAVHMIIGIGLLSVLLYFSAKGRYGPEYHSPVEVSVSTGTLSISFGFFFSRCFICWDDISEVTQARV